MPPKYLSARSRSLAAVRKVVDWDQSELARAAGVPSSIISDYERGHRQLSQAKLEELLGYFGLPPEATEWALGFTESIHNASQAPGEPGGPSVARRREIERISSGFGNRITEFVRSTLTYFTIEGRAFVLRERAPALWRMLKRHPPAERRRLAESTRELRSWALCELICAESIKAAADNADRAVELAELALLIAELTPLEGVWRSRVQGYAWAHVGNARRVRGDLPGAEQAFLRARKLWEDGEAGDPGILSEAQVLSLEASLRIDQVRLAEAAVLLDGALEKDKGSLRSNLLINKARLREWLGDYEGALTTLQEATSLIREQQDPRRLWMLRFHVANNLSHLSRFEAAEELLPEIRALTVKLGNQLDSLRSRWLEARIAAGLGRKLEALVMLSQLRAEFMGLGIPYDTALVTMEMATLQLELGHTRDIKLLSRHLVDIFQAEGIHREALAALKLFWDAAQKATASVNLARQVTEYLHKSRFNPSLRFEGF